MRLARCTTQFTGGQHWTNTCGQNNGAETVHLWKMLSECGMEDQCNPFAVSRYPLSILLKCWRRWFIKGRTEQQHRQRFCPSVPSADDTCRTVGGWLVSTGDHGLRSFYVFHNTLRTTCNVLWESVGEDYSSFANRIFRCGRREVSTTRQVAQWCCGRPCCCVPQVTGHLLQWSTKRSAFIKKIIRCSD